MKTSPVFLLASLILAAVAYFALAGEKGEKKAASSITAKPHDLSKMSKEELRKQLTPLQYHVACESGTEPPFRNEYWNNHADGIYVDVISGEPLFASIHKFDSGTGWPSFWQPIKKEAVKAKVDASIGAVRTEIRSAKSDAHLGHVFDDGPKPTGQRYCMNSASMRFVAKEKLQELGYGEYLSLFDKTAKK
ncbi:MAG: peptide-methionine (R)-S-oxide reductase MsrB [Chthoniobacteraceae bacterium]